MNDEKLLFDYFLSKLDYFNQENIKSSKDLIEYYESNNVITKDENYDNSPHGTNTIARDMYFAELEKE